MSTSKEQFIFLKNSLLLMDYAIKLGFILTYGEVSRTIEQQTIYFKSGKSKTMDSNHLRKMAIDLNFIKNGKLITDPEILLPIGKYWMSLHPKNRWGGDWNKNGSVKDENWHDCPHFEMLP